jgi:hypothetical protein
MTNDDKHINIDKDNNGITNTGDKNIIIQVFQNQYSMGLMIVLVIVAAALWYTNDKDTISNVANDNNGSEINITSKEPKDLKDSANGNSGSKINITF